MSHIEFQLSSLNRSWDSKLSPWGGSKVWSQLRKLFEMISTSLSLNFSFLAQTEAEIASWAPGGAQWAEGFKNEIFCLRILISWAQIDRWGLIRRGKIRNCSEILLLWKNQIWTHQGLAKIFWLSLVKMRFFGHCKKPRACGKCIYG